MKKLFPSIFMIIVAVFIVGGFFYFFQQSAKDKSTTANDEIQSKEAEQDQMDQDTNIDDFQRSKQIFTYRRIHIVAIGDSLTEGIGDNTQRGGYVGIIEKKINEQKLLADIENFGKSGNRTDQLIERLDIPEIANSIEKANIILITIGANDIMKVLRDNITDITYNPFAEEALHYEERLKNIFVKMRELNQDATIYLIGFYNPFQGYFQHIEELTKISNEWNEVGELVTRQFDHIYFIPIADLFHDHAESLLADDNFHPNTLGYKIMAERVLQYIKMENKRLQE